MARASRKAIGALLLAALICVAIGFFFGSEPPPGPLLPSAVDLVREKLHQSVSLDVQDVPFDRAIAELAEKHGLSIELDRAAIDDGTGWIAQPVTLRLHDVRLESALWILSHQLAPSSALPLSPANTIAGPGGTARVVYKNDLALAVVGDTVKITSQDVAAKLAVTKTYPVTDVLADHPRFTEENLADIVRTCFPNDPGAADDVDGCSAAPGALVVTRPALVHDEIARLLEAIRGVGASLAGLRPARPATETALANALKQPVDFEFREEPLARVLGELAKRYHVNLALDVLRAEEANVGMDTPITYHAAHVTLAAAMERLLWDLGLSYVVEHDAIIVTSKEFTDLRLVPAVYPVRDLLAHDARRSADDLATLVVDHIQPDVWKETGGASSLLWVPGGLVAHATAGIHAQVARFLDWLEQAHDPLLTDFDPLVRSPAERRLFRALEQKVSLQADGTPLKDVIAELREHSGVALEVSQKKLEEANVQLDTPIRKTLHDLPLRMALREVLTDLGLDYIVRDEIILVTSKEEHDTYLTTGIYRLGQLTAAPLPIEAEQLSDIMMDYVHSSSWRESGGPGRVDLFGNVLLIDQTRQVHEECQQMFAALAQFQEAAHVGDLIVGESAEDQRVRHALRKPITLAANGSLANIAKALEKACPGVRFEVDEKGIEKLGDDAESKHFHVALEEQPLAAALDSLCRQARSGWFFGPAIHLDWTIAQGGVRLTSPERPAWFDPSAARLFQVDREANGRMLTPDRLRDLILEHAPPAWGVEDGLAHAVPLPRGVLIAANRFTERRIWRLVEQLRHVLQPSCELPIESRTPPHHEALEDKLVRTARFECKSLALEGVLGHFELDRDITFLTDEPHLHRKYGQPGQSTFDFNVTCRAADVSLAELLDQVLSVHEIAWSHHDGKLVLMYSSRKRANDEPDAFVSDARPLVAALGGAKWIADKDATVVDFLRHAVNPAGVARNPPGRRLNDFTLIGPALVATHPWPDHLRARRLLAGADALREWFNAVTHGPTPPAEEAVLRGLEHPVESVRAFAAYWLAVQRAGSGKAVAALANASESPNQSVRLCALFAFARVPRRSPEFAAIVLPRVRKLLDDESLAISRYAAAVLAEFGPAAAGRVDSLVLPLYAGDDERREWVALALSRMGQPGLSVLLGGLGQTWINVRDVVIRGLARMTNDGFDAMPALAELIAAQGPGKLGADVCSTLRAIGQDGVRPLLQLASAPRCAPSLRLQAVETLGDIVHRPSEEERRLLEDLRQNDPEATVRRQAEETLQKLNYAGAQGQPGARDESRKSAP